MTKSDAIFVFLVMISNTDTHKRQTVGKNFLNRYLQIFTVFSKITYLPIFYIATITKPLSFAELTENKCIFKTIFYILFKLKIYIIIVFYIKGCTDKYHFEMLYST